MRYGKSQMPWMEDVECKSKREKRFFEGSNGFYEIPDKTRQFLEKLLRDYNRLTTLFGIRRELVNLRLL